MQIQQLCSVLSPAKDYSVKRRMFLFALVLLLIAPAGCLDGKVKKDFVLGRDFQPAVYSNLAVVNLDQKIQFAQYVEAELLRKGYQVKDAGTVSQWLKKEGMGKEGSLDLQSLKKIGDLLQVQGIVLCAVPEFSRFRDSYRLSIKCVTPETGDTLWYAEGSKEGKKGQKSGDLLKEIVASALSPLPRLR
jgi:hypothetical protein